MRGSRLFACWVLPAALLTVVAVPERGHSQTLQSCLSQQLRYAGTTCRGIGKCYARAWKKGLAVEQTCLDERDAEVQSRFGLIESQGDCLTEPAGASVANTLSTDLAGQASALGTTNRCSSGKIGAIGRACKQFFACYARSVDGSEPVDPFCLEKASIKMEEVFERLEMRQACFTTGDADARDTDNLQMAEDIYDYLRGTGTTTTTTSMSTSTTTIPTGCMVDGSVTACEAYRDNPACSGCVDLVGGVAESQCTAAKDHNPSCSDAFNNEGCAYAINTETTCGPTCCP